jgi:hypothetical protein
MLDKSEHDMTQQQAELIELSTMWDRVCKLSVNKQEKLEQAHKLVSLSLFNIVNQLLFSSEEILRGSQEPHCREYFSS